MERCNNESDFSRMYELKRQKSTHDLRKELETIIKKSDALRSREFNGRWYTDVKAWKIEGYAEHLGQQEEEY